MDKPLRILNVEDSERDSTLLNRHLKNAGYELIWDRVQTAHSFEIALTSKEWDLILCDYKMPRFTATAALAVLRRSGLDIPFIIISGTIGEEIAVESLLSGANDYIPKGNLTRLVPAIKRELLQAENRREKRQADLERRKSDDRYRALFEYAPDGIIISSADDYYLDANASMCRMLGYTHDELIGMHASDIVIRSEVRDLDYEFSLVESTPGYNREWHFRRKDGSNFPGEVIATIMPDGNLLAMIRDVTERNASEKELNIIQANLARAQQIAHLGSWEMDLPLLTDDGENALRWSDEVFRIFGYRPGEIVVSNENFYKAVHPDDSETVKAAMGEAIREGKTYSLDHRIVLPDGSERIVHEHSEIVRDEISGEPTKMIGTVQDVTERKRAEEDIQRRQTELRVLFDVMPAMIWFKDTENKILRVNKRVAEAAGRSVSEIEGKPASEIYPEAAADFYADDLKVIGSGVPKLGYEEMLPGPDGTELWVQTDKVPYFDKNGQPIGIVVMAQDITARKRAEDEKTRLYAEIEGQRHRLNNIVSSVPGVVFESWSSPDPARQQTNFVSGYVETMLGYTVAEWLAKPDFWVSIVHPDDRERVVRLTAERGIEKDLALEFRWISKAGEAIWVEAKSVITKDENGRAVGVRGVTINITERKRAEEELRQSDEKFHQLADNITDAFWIRSPDLNEIYYISPAFEQIWGRTLEQVFAEPTEWLKYILPVDREFVANAYKGLTGPDAAMDIEYRIVRADGEIRWLRTRGFQVRDAEGRLIRLAGVVTDTTERRQISEALRESEERYRDLVENAIDVIYTLDLEGNYTSMNRASEDLTGYTVEESLKRNIVDSITPEFRDKAKQMLKAQLHGENLSAFELEIIAKDGRRVALEIKTRPIKENGIPVGVQGIARDITERKRTQAALEKSELRYHSLFENMLEGYAYCQTIFEGDKLEDFVYLEVNGAFETLTGLKNVVGKNISELIPELAHTNPNVFATYGRVANTGRPERFETYVEPLKSWLSITLYSSDRDHFVAVFDNITERKRAEVLLTESQEQLALAAESANLGIWDWDVVADRLVWDNRMYELYGIQAGEFSGAYEAWQKGLHPDDKKTGDDNIHAALADERPFSNEFRVVWPNGEVRNVEARALVKRDSSGSPVRMIGVNWDITDRKTLEEQYRQSQKMEAVGVLAGGIAHDFNNLLTAINGFSDLALRRMEADSPFRRNIQEIKNAGTRATELTGQLLAFSRKQVLKPSVINLNAVISNIETMLRRIIRESVELRVILDPKLGNVLADAGQVEQVIMNLSINARHAMPNGGLLTIETTNVYLGEDYVNRHILVSPGEFVRITVSDTGEGMDAVTQSHIFEPFFTTKEVGKGTGLGLATVYGIVKQSGGTILVYSELGHGTNFKIYLPCVDQPVAGPRSAGEKETSYLGTETILLVEDEDAVRSFAAEVLETSGYKVLAASSGPDALAICRTYTEPIHLLVSDVIMPKMGGAELKKRVVELLPQIKVLFISGYTDDSISARGIDDPNIAFLEKPFNPDSLSRKVRGVLDS